MMQVQPIYRSKNYGLVVFEALQQDCRAFRFRALGREPKQDRYLCHVVSLGEDFDLGPQANGLISLLRETNIPNHWVRFSAADRMVAKVLIDHQLSGDDVVKSFRNIINNAYSGMKITRNYIAGYDVTINGQQLNREAIFDYMPSEAN